MTTPALPSPQGVNLAGPAAGRRPEPLLARLRRFFTGDDVFISYARADASAYALALAARLTRARFSCYLDQFGTQPREALPEDLRRALLGSGTFVLVASPLAASSKAVAEELALFRPLGRPLLVVSVEGSERAAPWASNVAGAARTVETFAALRTGRPSRVVVTRIGEAVGFRKRTFRLRKAVGSAVAATAVLLLGSAAWLKVTTDRATLQENRAASIDYSIQALDARSANPDQAIGLALMAGHIEGTLQARRTLIEVVRPFPRLLHLYRPHGGGEVWDVAFSPRGGLLASVGADGHVRFYDVPNRRMLPPGTPVGPPGRPASAATLAFSPRGRWLASVDLDGRLVLWDVDRRIPVAALRMRDSLSAVAFRNETELATGSLLGDVRLWQVDAGHGIIPMSSVRVGPFATHVQSLAYSPDGASLAVATANGAWLLDAATLAPRDDFSRQTWRDGVRKMRFNRDGTLLGALTVNRYAALPGGIVSWRSATGAPLDSSLPVEFSAQDFVFAGAEVVALRDSQEIIAWDTTALVRWGNSFSYDTVARYPPGIHRLSFDPGSSLLASANTGGTVAVWRVDGPAPWSQWVPEAEQAANRGISLDQSGGRLAVAGSDTVYVWNTSTWATVLKRPHPRVSALAISPDGRLIAVASDDSVVTVYAVDGDSMQRPVVLPGRALLNGLLFSDDGSRLSGWAQSKDEVLVWTVSGHDQRRAPQRLRARRTLAIRGDGRLMAVEGTAGNLQLINLRSGESRVRAWPDGRRDTVMAAAFSPGGHSVVAYHRRGELARWPVSGDGPPRVVGRVSNARTSLDQNSVEDAVLSRDGRVLVVHLSSIGIRVWSVTDQGQIAEWAYPASDLTQLAVSGDGTRFVRRGLESRDQFWNMDPEHWRAVGCSLVAGSTILPELAANGSMNPCTGVELPPANPVRH